MLIIQGININILSPYYISKIYYSPHFQIHSVLIHKSREDENVITYIYPLKKKQKHNHIILNRSQRIYVCVCVCV